MKRFWVALLPLAACFASAAPATNFVVYGGDKPAGKAYAKLEAQPEGGRRFVLTMMLRLNGRDLQIRTEAFYDDKGVAVRRKQEMGPSGKPPTSIVDVNFAPDKAVVTVTESGKVKRIETAIDPSLPRTDALTLWTPKRFPSVGTRLAQYSFDMAKHEFTMANTTYGGLEELVLGKEKVRGHKVVTESRGNTYEMWVDDEGMPYRMNLGTFRLDRVIEPAASS